MDSKDSKNEISPADAQTPFIIYGNADDQVKVRVFLHEETLWLSQVEIAELFDTTKQNVSAHLINIYEDEELEEESTVKDFLTVQNEGRRSVRRTLKFYNLDAIIAVGYRVCQNTEI